MPSFVRGLRGRTNVSGKEGQIGRDLISSLQEHIEQRARMASHSATCTVLAMPEWHVGERVTYRVYHPARSDGLYDAVEITERPGFPMIVEYQELSADDVDDLFQDALTHHEAGLCPPP